MEVCSCDSQEVVMSCRVKCECAWSEVWLGGVKCECAWSEVWLGGVKCECARSEVWLGGVWCVRVHGVRRGWVECGV